MGFLCLAARTAHLTAGRQNALGRHISAIRLTLLYYSVFIFCHVLWQKSHKVLRSFCRVKVWWPSMILQRRNIILEGMFIISENSPFSMPREQFFWTYLDDSSTPLARPPDEASPAKWFWSQSGKQHHINSRAEQITSKKLLIFLKTSFHCLHDIPESNAVSLRAEGLLIFIKKKWNPWYQKGCLQNGWQWWSSPSAETLLHNCTWLSVQALETQLAALFVLTQPSQKGAMRSQPKQTCFKI